LHPCHILSASPPFVLLTSIWTRPDIAVLARAAALSGAPAVPDSRALGLVGGKILKEVTEVKPGWDGSGGED